MRRWGKFAGIIAVLAVLVLIGLWNVPRPDPLSTCTVVGMRAWLGNSPRHLPDLSWFDVPPEHVPLVRESLEPAVRDAKPAKWQSLGFLECSCADGSTRDIHLYWTRHGPGAFSVGRRNTYQWRYYRGGTDQGIEDAIRDAYAATKK